MHVSSFAYFRSVLPWIDALLKYMILGSSLWFPLHGQKQGAELQYLAKWHVVVFMEYQKI